MHFFQLISTNKKQVSCFKLWRKNKGSFFSPHCRDGFHVFLIILLCCLSSLSLPRVVSMLCPLSAQKCWRIGYGWKDNTFKGGSLLLITYTPMEITVTKTTAAYVAGSHSCAATLWHGGVLLWRLTVTQQSNGALISEQHILSWEELCASVC